MDLGQMTTELRTKLGNLTTAQISDSELHTTINKAYQFLLDRYAHTHGRAWFTFDTVIGEENYVIPANYGAILEVYDRSQRTPLRKITKNDIPHWDTQPARRPVVWFRDGVEVILLPVADAIYTIGIYGKIVNSPLILSTDAPVLDTTWHDGIVLRARYLYYDSIGDIPKAQYASGSFREWISDKPTIIEEEQAAHEKGISIPGLRSGSMQRLPSSRINDNDWANPWYPE